MTQHLDSDNFENTIAKGVTLVDFYATWCGPCRMIVPIVEALSQKYAGKAKIGKLDIDQAQDIASNFAITSVPTLIVFKDGKEVSRIIGVKDEGFLSKEIDRHL